MSAQSKPVVYPTPLTDNEDRWEVDKSEIGPLCEYAVRIDFARQLERDCLTLAMVLYARSDSSLSPEAAAVMEEWRPRVEQLVAEGCK